MSNVIKSLFIATILFTSMSPVIVFSQEPSPNKTRNVEGAHDSLSTEPASILIMRPELDSLCKMADEIAARNKHIRIEEPGADSGEPKQLEAELWLQPEVPCEIVEQIIGDVAKFGIARIQLFLPFHDPDNTVVITAPADTSQTAIKDLQTNLALPDGFKLDVRIRDNKPSPSIMPSQEIQSQITQLEVELAVQKLRLGPDHPSILSLEERIAALRKAEKNEPKPPVTVVPLRHAKAKDVAEKFKMLNMGDVEAVVVDERTNSLLIRADKEQLGEIQYLVETLDVEETTRGEENVQGKSSAGSTEPPIKAFALKHIAAVEAQRILQELFGNDRTAITAEPRTNTLLVRGEPEQLEVIEAILLRLDEKAPEEPKDASSQSSQENVPFNSSATETETANGGDSNAGGVSIAEYRRRLVDLEKPVLEFAEKVRASEGSLGKQHPEHQKLLADLRALVQQTFAARQEIQRAELAEFTRRLERMKQAIETREKIADKIVDRRIEELLHPETDWNAASSLPRPASRSAVASSPLRSDSDSPNGNLSSFLGTWEVEELNIKSAGIDIAAVAPKPTLTVTENQFVVPMDGGITVTMKYELVAGDPLRVNLTFDGSNAQTFGIIKHTDDSFWLCFREPADVGAPGLTENDRPIAFLPGEQNYFLKCQRTLPVNQPEGGTSADLERTPPVTITRTYHVGNYVTATFFEQAIGTQRTAASLDAAAEKIRQKAEELITQVSSHNRPAAIGFDSARLQLVVSHTAEGHRALGELFATIKLPMQEKLTFSRCEVNEQIYSAFKDSPVWTAFDEFRNEVEDGGWIGVRKKEFVTWFERVLKESPAGEDFGQPMSLVLTAGVPYQFDAGEIRVALTARISPASQKPELRIDYADLSGRPSGTRMINNLEDLAVYVPSSEGSITFLVHESAQGGSFPLRDSLQKQDSALLKPIHVAPEVTKEEPRPVQIRLTSGVEGSVTTVSCTVGVPLVFYLQEGTDRGPYQLTFERNGSNENSQAWLNNNTLPVEYLADDQERAAAGQLVTKVIYLNSDTGGVETISGHSVEAGVDPVSVAAEKGTVIGVVRISRTRTHLEAAGHPVTISLEAYELDPKDESTVSLLDPGKPVSESIERDVKALLEAKKIKRLVNTDVEAVIGKESEVVSGGVAPVNPASLKDGLVTFGTILSMTPGETNGVPGIVGTVRIVDRRGIEKAKSGVSLDAKEYHFADHNLSYLDRGKLFGPFEKSAVRAVIIRLRISKHEQQVAIPDASK